MLAFIVAQAGEGERPGMVKVRKAVSTRSERVDEALERLKERGEILDLDRGGCPHPGTAGTPRYWIPRNHAGSQAVRGGGTASDSFDFGPQDGERPSGEAVPLSRRKEGQPPPDSLDGVDTTGDDNPRCETLEKRRRGTEPDESTRLCDEDVIDRWERRAGGEEGWKHIETLVSETGFEVSIEGRIAGDGGES